jgi:hypothetical protein
MTSVKSPTAARGCNKTLPHKAKLTSKHLLCDLEPGELLLDANIRVAFSHSRYLQRLYEIPTKTY